MRQYTEKDADASIAAKMKICIIANPNSPHTHRWIDHFSGRGFDIHLIGYTPMIRSMPENVTFYDLTRMSNVRKVRFALWGYKIRKLVQGIQPDMLHIHGVAGYGWLGAAANFHPFLVTVHGSDVLLLKQRSWLHQKLSLWALRKADYITCVSIHLVQLVQKLGITGKPLEVAYLGVDTKIFHPAKTNPEFLRSQHQIDDGKIILSVRTLKPLYNPLDIARVIPRVLRHVPSAKFLIFTYNAEPFLLTQFKEIVENSQSTDSVYYVESLSNDQKLAAYYQAADVALSLASSDGTPKSVQEAMACGAVPVLGNLPTLHEWVTHEKEGFFVPIGDMQATAKTLVKLLTDDRLCSDISKNAIEKIYQKADQEQCMLKYEQIYRDLAGPKNTQR